MLAGIPGHNIEDIKISSVLLQHAGGGTQKDAALRFEEKEKEYPEPKMFGTTPAHAFYIRHARRVEIRDFKIVAQEKEERPCFILEDVEDIEFSNINFPERQRVPKFVLNGVRNFGVVDSRPLPDTEVKETTRQDL